MQIVGQLFAHMCDAACWNCGLCWALQQPHTDACDSDQSRLLCLHTAAGVWTPSCILGASFFQIAFVTVRCELSLSAVDSWVGAFFGVAVASSQVTALLLRCEHARTHCPPSLERTCNVLTREGQQPRTPTPKLDTSTRTEQPTQLDTIQMKPAPVAVERLGHQLGPAAIRQTCIDTGGCQCCPGTPQTQTPVLARAALTPYALQLVSPG